MKTLAPSIWLAWIPLGLLAHGAVPQESQGSPAASVRSNRDWLLEANPSPAEVRVEEDGRSIALGNGLVRKVFRVVPDLACVALDDLRTGESRLRSVRPEGRVEVNGIEVTLGGLSGQTNHAFLDAETLEVLVEDAHTMHLVGWEQVSPEARIPWKRVRHHAPDVEWPPKGVGLRFDLAFDQVGAKAALERALVTEGGEPPSSREVDRLLGALLSMRVSVHHELYDGVPLFGKWITVHNAGDSVFTVDRYTSEILAVVERDSFVEDRGTHISPPDLHIECEYALGGLSHLNSHRFSVRWLEDPSYHTQVSYRKVTPCLLEIGPERQVARDVEPGGRLESFRSYVLVHDSEDRTRRSLGLTRMYKTIAPWVTENPLMMHVRFADPESVHAAIDQCAEVGFEMVILTFGSGFNMEDRRPETLARMKEYADYARQRGVEIGGYSLLSSRRIQPEEDNCIHPDTGKPGGQTHGTCPALASSWGQDYLKTVRSFYSETGFSLLEHDGPYPGDLDASARPPLQRGLEDSRYVQWRLSADLYGWMRSEGIYINAPDWYFLAGSNKCGMGYREVNWSLPRRQQVIHTRQNIFDGTRTKLPSMGWMFVPLTEYHGGGPAATVEPLHEHRDHYRQMLMSNLGAGVQACYRGPRLFDTQETRDLVEGAVDWFLEHREILESPVVHASSRRADGRDLDWILHANPGSELPGMLVVHNPLRVAVQRNLELDLYYTGIEGRALAIGANGEHTSVTLDPQGRTGLEVSVPARGSAWYRIREAK